MSIEKLSAAELLSKDKFNVNEETAHIVLDKALCAQCDEKPCLYICPAVLYQLDKNGEMRFDYVGCLECGTCRIMCKKRGITNWVYPEATFGVIYKYS